MQYSSNDPRYEALFTTSCHSHSDGLQPNGEDFYVFGISGPWEILGSDLKFSRSD